MTPRLFPAALAAATTVALSACQPDSALRPDRAAPARLTLDAASSALTSLGDTALVVPHVLDAAGRPVTDAPLRWTVRAAGVVAQDGAGVFRAVGNGRVTVVAEVDPGQTGVRPAGYYVGPVSDSVVLTVQQRAARFALDPVDTLFTTLGATRALRVRVADARGNLMPVALAAPVFRTANAAVAEVDTAGTVRSRAEGAAQVTVAAQGLSGAITFAVRPRLPHTSCMRFAQRRQSRQSCVTLDLVVRERGTTR